MGPIFSTPVRVEDGGPVAFLMVPGSTGGANWPGGALDPETGVFYVFSQTAPRALALAPNPEVSDMDYVTSSTRAVTVQGLPLLKPPWGRITAIDLNLGEIVWQVAHGETPDAVKSHPVLAGVAIPRTGSGRILGTLVTSELVISGEGIVTTTSTGEPGAMLRAYDKATGVEVGAVYMPAPQTGSPMTYEIDGRQFLVVPVSGPGFPGEFVAFSLN